MFLTTVYSFCLVCLLGIFSVSCATCPTNSGTRCIFGDYCPTPGASCVEGYCRCHGSSKYDNCTCLPHVSGCLIKRSPSTYVGLPSTDGRPEMPYYGCVSSLLNCDYEVHVIANYESSNGHHGFGIPSVPGSTYVHFNINGQSSKPLVLVFTSYEPVNWVLYLPSGVVVNRILVGGYHTSKIVGNPATNVEVHPRNRLSLQSGYGSDDGGGHTADTLTYLTNRFGPISSFSGSYRADRWTINIKRSPACNSSEPLKSVVVRFEKERYTVNEGAGSVTLVLLITQPNPNNTTVLYSTTNETALAPMDYTAANQIRINYPAGYSRLKLSIPIRDDDLHELSETFQVQVLLPNKPVPAVIEIIDNDPVVAQFDRSSYIFSNNVGQGTVAVEITGRSEVDIILQYSIKDNRARVTNHSITIAAGSNRIEFNVSINNVQINGPLQVELVNDTTHGVAVGVPNRATIEIINGSSALTCPTDSGTRCIGSDYCSESSLRGASCVGGYCRCHGSSKYDNCTCLPHVSGCLVKRSPSMYVGFPSTDGRPEMTYYGCVSDLFNCDYEVHVIANYESSNGHHGFGIPRVAGSTYVQFNISGQSSKPLVLVFTSHEPVNWQLYLPSGAVVNRILVGGFHTSKIVGNAATKFNIEVLPYNRLSLQPGHGPDDGGGRTADTLTYLTNRFGPISSFSGSYRADRWTVNIERSLACNSSEPLKSVMVRFEKERYTVNEGAGSVTLVLLITHPNPDNTTVLYSTVNENALAPMDYTAANQILVNFPAGYSRLELTIPIQDDDLYELSETFQVQVLLPNKPVPAIVEIIDNDRQDVTPMTTGGRIAGAIAGAIAGVFLLVVVIAAVFYITVRICRAKSQHARATNTHMTHSSNGTTTSTGSIPLSTQPHPPPTTTFNLPQPQPQSAPVLTFTQPSNSSITEVPPPAYHFHETFANYSENKKPSDDPPPYHPPSYDVATEEAKYGFPNTPQD